MFRFSKERKVWWPVRIAVPQDGGTTERIEIKAYFKLLTVAESEQATAGGGIFTNAKAFEMLAEHVLGWEGVGDEDGAPVQWSPETCRAVLSEPFVRNAFLDAWIAASNGAAAKNSATGSGG